MQLKHIIRTVLNVVPLLLLPLGAESGLASPKDFNTDRSDNTVYVMPDEFVCQTNADGMLATYAVRGHRELDIIAWSEWEDPRYPPEVRCSIVSDRLEEAVRADRLKFMTNGWYNNQPVICTASYEGGPCTHLLVTLRHRDTNRAADMMRYLAIRGIGGGNGAIVMSGCNRTDSTQPQSFGAGGSSGSARPSSAMTEINGQVYVDMEAIFANTLGCD